jgi:hypothetical protein
MIVLLVSAQIDDYVAMIAVPQFLGDDPHSPPVR